MRYSEHHLHTTFSPLDGVSSADDYMRRAKQIGVDHLTITDHGTLGGHHEFQQAGDQHGISVGLGLETYFSSTDRFDRRGNDERDDGSQIYNHMGLIAKNQTGLKNLNHMNRLAWTEGYFYKPRIDLDLLKEYRDGLIVLSGCLSGVVSKQLEAGNFEKALSWAMELKDIFGDDFYIEVMTHNPPNLTEGHFKIADQLGIRPVITSDCHHSAPDDLIKQEAMLILQTSPKEAKGWDFSKAQKMDLLERFNYMYPERGMTFQDYELHLHHGTEQFKKMEALGYGRTDFIESTTEIADKIGEYPSFKGLDLLPRPKVKDVDEHLRKKVMSGAKKRGHFDDPVYMERLESELKVIREKNFSTYFLIKANIDTWARKQGIRTGPGRGSSAGSLVCYDLYITQVDPIEYGLLFERFLEKSRTDMPDIDSDYPDDRRHEVKAYMKRTFKNTGNIQTYTYLEGKNILKDACKILKVPYAISNEVSQRINDWDDFTTSPKTAVFRHKYPEVERLGNIIRGGLRSVGIHAAGVVVSSEPISNYAPVESSTDPDNKANARIEVLAMNDSRAAELGLIKFDILGLSALTNIQDTVELIVQRHGKEIDIDSLPLDDDQVYASINKNSSLGLFQIEGSAFTKILEEMPIEEFNDLVAGTALIRPGAADSSFGKSFLRARNGGRWKPYCDAMRSFTEDTFGSILYQEQLMLTCTQVAGMTSGEANKIRKIIGKKRDVEELEQYKKKFVVGASEDLGVEGAEKMWEDFEKASNYQFNKSHAVAYSLITYQTAWLKHYYPVEFMMALLSKETDVIKRINYLNDCKRMGIRIKIPHVEHSSLNMQISTDAQGDFLRMGLSDAKYVGPAMAQKIINNRPYHSFKALIDFSQQKYSGVNKRGIDYLDRVGACRYEDNPLRGDERSYYFDVLNIPSFDTASLPTSAVKVLQRVENYSKEGTFVMLSLVQQVTRKKGWARADLFDETGTVGIFFNPDEDIKKGEFYIFLIANGSIIEYKQAKDFDDGSPLSKYLTTETLKSFEGYRVLDFSTRKTKTGKTMGTLVVTDNEKNLSAFTVFSDNVYKVHDIVSKARPVQIDFSQNTWKGTKSNILRSIK